MVTALVVVLLLGAALDLAIRGISRRWPSGADRAAWVVASFVFAVVVLAVVFGVAWLLVQLKTALL